MVDIYPSAVPEVELETGSGLRLRGRSKFTGDTGWREKYLIDF
jgi:hypothetical protein